MAKFPDLQNLIEDIDQRLAKASKGVPTISPLLQKREKVNRFVLVRTGQLHVAVAIGDMVAVGHLPPVTFLPNLPQWIYGVTNMRGEVVSVINLPMFLDSDVGKTDDGRRLVVLQDKKRKVGLRVHQIVATVSRSNSELSVLSQDEEGMYKQTFFSQKMLHSKDSYCILNVEKLLNEPRFIDYYGYAWS